MTYPTEAEILREKIEDLEDDHRVMLRALLGVAHHLKRMRVDAVAAWAIEDWEMAVYDALLEVGVSVDRLPAIEDFQP